MTKDVIATLNHFPKHDDKFYYYKNSLKYNGSAREDKEVYYLMGKGSGSATDNYLQTVKQNDLGLLVVQYVEELYRISILGNQGKIMS